ncbi:MAG TPA: efflux RND transporter periplasmic adaptor subunit [Terriglobales bacterium]|jgi:HlyD family secretion protein|nr:efflux RND transporter periplasmic adaptor subunit [Terriglobales bacterium]
MNWKKIGIIAGAAVLLGSVVGFTVYQSRKNVVAVQSGRVVREDLASIVSASGEINPQTYVNIGANAFGKITRLYVKEGDRVKRGQLLAQIENVQPAADVSAMQASLQAANGDAAAADAAYNTAVADLARAKADAAQKKLDYERAQSLFRDQLIAKQEFDAREAAWEASASGLQQAQARIIQTKAQRDAAHDRIKQAAASLTHASDVLQKTVYTAPFEGTISNLPVREGETVVIGIQNQPGSTLMTLADMSVITAEVKVDETDIVNVKLGQLADVTIDAIPNKVFKGHVSEIGENAIVRSTGVATSQTLASSQEAKDFKVKVTLDDPPQNLRPGLSTTAKITTATRSSVLAIPIQALTIRQRADLDPKSKGKGSVQAAAPSPAQAKKAKEDIQGVFVIRDGKAVFVPVETGITGTTDIEITSGLQLGDEIVVGSYKVLRTLKNEARVKIDNTVKKQEET